MTDDELAAEHERLAAAYDGKAERHRAIAAELRGTPAKAPKKGLRKAPRERPTSGPRAAKRDAILAQARPLLAKEPGMSTNTLRQRLGVSWGRAAWAKTQCVHKSA